jgi:UDP-N-acetylglucosamine 2-epimerase
MVGKRFHVLVVFGTRPEAIKLAPVVRELSRFPEQFKVSVCITAQHRHLLDPILRWFSNSGTLRSERHATRSGIVRVVGPHF